jgi:2-polyprenyl-6-methoxyphenol hydroxylase-like FAD-dependent oxidoreductase
MAQTRTFDFSILGGGIGGCISALRLADAGYTIQLIDQSTLLSGSSKNTACRLGLGLHYAHLKTALQYLNATIKFVRAHPGFAIGDKQTSSNSSDSDAQKNFLYVSQHVRYFIAKDSLFTTSEISTIQEALKAEYERLVKADSGNQVFGKPSEFYRALTLAECKDVNPDEVTAGFKAAERILDWESFQNYLIDKILKHPNITVIENAKISDISYVKQGYVFEAKMHANQEDKDVPSINPTKRLILAAWQNNEWFANTLGFPMNPGSRINRTKIIAIVKLPSEFYKVPSMFFCSGPFAAFTNHGNGTAFVSYEPVTNIEQNDSLVLNELSKQLIDQGATEEQIQKYGKAILEGAKKYIPGIEKAEVVGAKIGIVKIKKNNGEWIRVIEKNDSAAMHSNTNAGMMEEKKTIKTKTSWELKDALCAQVDIYDKQSDVHERLSFGVEEYGLFLNANSCNKLLYCEENADILLQIVSKQRVLEKEFDVFVDKIINRLVKDKLTKEEKASNFKHVVTANFSRLIKSSDPQALGKEQRDNFADQIVRRALLIQGIKKSTRKKKSELEGEDDSRETNECINYEFKSGEAQTQRADGILLAEVSSPLLGSDSHSPATTASDFVSESEVTDTNDSSAFESPVLSRNSASSSNGSLPAFDLTESPDKRRNSSETNTTYRPTNRSLSESFPNRSYSSGVVRNSCLKSTLKETPSSSQHQLDNCVGSDKPCETSTSLK